MREGGRGAKHIKCVVLLDVLRSVTFLTVTPNSYARR